MGICGYLFATEKALRMNIRNDQNQTIKTTPRVLQGAKLLEGLESLEGLEYLFGSFLTP